MDSHLAEAQFLIDAQLKAKAPVHITVLKNNSLYVTLTPTETGMGFQLRGSAPVIVNEVDKGNTQEGSFGVPPHHVLIELPQDHTCLYHITFSHDCEHPL